MTTRAQKIVNRMFEHDEFSQWLGIERLVVEDGHCILRMKVRREMLNGFGILHGGISFALADSALAFASNSHGRKSVSVEASMAYTEQVREGEVITASARESSLTNKIGIYDIVIARANQVKIGLFRGIVYRTGNEWPED